MAGGGKRVGGGTPPSSRSSTTPARSYARPTARAARAEAEGAPGSRPRPRAAPGEAASAPGARTTVAGRRRGGPRGSRFRSAPEAGTGSGRRTCATRHRPRRDCATAAAWHTRCRAQRDGGRLRKRRRPHRRSSRARAPSTWRRPGPEPPRRAQTHPGGGACRRLALIVETAGPETPVSPIVSWAVVCESGNPLPLRFPNQINFRLN